MKLLFSHKYLYIGIAVIVIILVILMIKGVAGKGDVEEVTVLVETGPVRELVSVSGVAEAEQSADLAFPTGGIVEEVLVKEGDEVMAGDVLIQLDARALYADRQDALAAVARAVAERDELLSGPTGSAREVTAETLAAKIEALETTKENEAQKVENAYRALLSTDLTAYSDDDDEDATPPTISGTYTCESEGTYVIDVFSSGASSGYSFRISGLESGVYVASVEQATEMGKCGLRIQFDDTSKYDQTEWKIDVPNIKSSLYVTNRNAYALAVTQAESAITNAEQAVALAEASASDQNAPARSEAIVRANAAVSQAQARLNRIDSTIADRTLTAPFAGVITDISVLPGETVTALPIVTLLASSEFEVIARIPEIDIGKLLTGQRVEMLFDARSGEIVSGEVVFISPQATEIDGVAYYEATIEFDELPVWIRSGLNADIEIIINEETDTLRIPKRFVSKTSTGYEVLLRRGETTASTTVTVLLEGNDGFVAITGLTEGDLLVAP